MVISSHYGSFLNHSWFYSDFVSRTRHNAPGAALGSHAESPICTEPCFLTLWHPWHYWTCFLSHLIDCVALQGGFSTWQPHNLHFLLVIPKFSVALAGGQRGLLAGICALGQCLRKLLGLKKCTMSPVKKLLYANLLWNWFCCASQESLRMIKVTLSVRADYNNYFFIWSVSLLLFLILGCLILHLYIFKMVSLFCH